MARDILVLHVVEVRSPFQALAQILLLDVEMESVMLVNLKKFVLILRILVTQTVNKR